jgi:hypothetical protein
VNFTREPIIETVITPREGCKLVVRNSKGVGQEDYLVDAVEVVSFGHSFFFRSPERPKSFLVPVSDYEVLESKEVRVALKNASVDRSIKIGGGRENPVRVHREVGPEESLEPVISTPEPPLVESVGATPIDRNEKKRDRRRPRRRRNGLGQELIQEEPSATSEGIGKGEESAAPSFISKLFPPPPTLIKETLGRYKAMEKKVIVDEKASFPEDLESPFVEPRLNLDEETRFED